MLLLVVAVSSRSLWIDEAWTAYFARMASVKVWWPELVLARETNLQMPLYSLWIFGVEKIAGSSEFALRFVNFCWLLPALVVAVRALAGRPQAVTLFLAATLNGFVWYYLDEARSYTMQLSAALVVYAAAVRLVTGPLPDRRMERRWVLAFAVGMALLCGSSLLAMYLAMIPLLALAAVLPRPQALALLRSHWKIWLALAVGLAGWAGFYLWTLRLGARATGIAGTDWRNPLFVAYELLGFTGLGPGRAEMRSGGLGVFRPYLIGMLLYAALAGVLSVAALAQLRRLGMRRILLMLLAIAVPVALLFLASHLKQFRILGRHFAALAPVVFLVFGGGIVVAWRQGVMGRWVVVGFMALSLVSVFSIRFASRHQREDYREAARLANDALMRGERVWWNADAKAAAYYQLPVVEETAPQPSVPTAVCLVNPSAGAFSASPRPEMVVCSRPEVYDGAGAVAAYLKANGYQPAARLPGFVIWRNSAGGI